MKQDIAIYKVDSFVDYAGREHKLVACALSQSPDNSERTLKVGWADVKDVLCSDCHIYNDVYRLVTLGIAICNPEDEFDLEVGKKTAYNKAAHREDLPRLYATSKGMITQDLVEAFINTQLKFYKENPEALIPGYNEAARKYKLIQQAKADIANLTGDDKVIFDLAVKGVNFMKSLDLAKIYLSKIQPNE